MRLKCLFVVSSRVKVDLQKDWVLVWEFIYIIKIIIKQRNMMKGKL